MYKNGDIRGFHDSLWIAALKPKNISCKKMDSGSFRLFVVDNIGNSDFIPICNYSKYFAKKKILRKWKHFEDSMLNTYKRNKALHRMLTSSHRWAKRLGSHRNNFYWILKKWKQLSVFSILIKRPDRAQIKKEWIENVIENPKTQLKLRCSQMAGKGCGQKYKQWKNIFECLYWTMEKQFIMPFSIES